MNASPQVAAPPMLTSSGAIRTHSTMNGSGAQVPAGVSRPGICTFPAPEPAPDRRGHEDQLHGRGGEQVSSANSQPYSRLDRK